MTNLLQISIEKGVWTVCLNRPAERNVLSIDLMKALTETAVQLHDEPDVKAVVLAANGANFSAGADLKDPRRWNLDEASLAERRALPRIGERMCQAWEDVPAVTICAIEGYCIGGGMALAASLDFRVIAASAYFRLPEIALGIPLSWGALPRLLRLIGPARTRRAVILCDRIDGTEAVAIGMADYLARDGEAYAESVQLAQRIAELPSVPVRMSKEAINVAANALNRLSSFMACDQLALAAHDPEAVDARMRFAAKKVR